MAASASARDALAPQASAPPEPDVESAWRLGSLLDSAGATEPLAAAMLEAANLGDAGREDELAAARAIGKLGEQAGKAALLSALTAGEALHKLVDKVWPSFARLADPEEAATADELASKFEVSAFELQLSGLREFYGGLDAIIGNPNPNIEQCALLH